MAEEKTKNGWSILVVAVVTVILLWLANWFLLHLFGGESDKRGQFGDMFGAANALFSGLAFAFLIYTIWLQREELRLQREELQMQRRALELQAEELKRQADELGRTAKLQEEAVELQKQQLKLTQNQIDLANEKQTKAHFVQAGDFRVYLSGIASITLRLRNTAAPASSLKVKSDVNLMPFDGVTFLSTNEEISITWQYDNVGLISEEVDLQISYIDTLGDRQIQNFKIIRDKEAKSIEDMFKLIRL